ncbi:FRG domain-containing protein [Leptothoe sp. LEGE 181152]|nr:FRG domain-containing protein [Leptothoe sp. LEGE 181152]
MEHVPEIEISSAMELVELLDRFGETPDLLFRGQSAQYEELTTSIERHRFEAEDIERFEGVASHIFRSGMSAFDSLYGHLTAAEAYLLRLFQSRAQHHLTTVPQAHETSAWLALMQHYGAPTRLLDVTKSLMIAAYFATEHSSRYSGTIFVFFTPSLPLENEIVDGQISHGGGLKSQDISFANKLNQATGSQLADWVIQQRGLKGILQVETAYPTRREIAQQGCFLMPLSLVESLESHIAYTYKFMNATPRDVPSKLEEVELEAFMRHWPVMKLRIPRDKFRLFRISLKHMGITPEMVYPDFDGLAKFMHGELEWHKEVNGMCP